MVWEPVGIKIVTSKDSSTIDRQFMLRYSYGVAWNESQDKVTKTGAVIVNKEGNILSYGANKFPKGVQLLPERFERPLKYGFIEHCERGAIYKAAKRGVSLDGSIMFSNWSPCDDCARGIIESGIETYVGHYEMLMKTPERWQPSIDNALTMLKEANIDVLMFQGRIFDCKALFDGQEWYP